jgi:hypothetical protein
MPLGNHDGNKNISIAASSWAPRRPSGTLPPESAKAGYHGIYDARGKYTPLINGLVEICSMTRRCFGLAGRSRADGDDHCGREPEIEIRRYQRAAHGFRCDLPTVRAFRRAAIRAAGAVFDFHTEFIVQHCGRERDPRASVIQVRISQDCTRLPRLRKKHNRHEQIPTPLVGHSCGASPSPHITPISGSFPGDIHTWAYAPGPLTGDIGRGPGTCARRPGRTPPNSHEKSALIRCVVGWVESGYIERGAHDTRHLSSCLVTSSGISGQIRGGSGGR